MAQIKPLKFGTDSLATEADTTADDVTFNSYTVDGGSIALTSTGLEMDSTKITGLATPSLGGDATNKTYVDNVAAGLDVKESVRAATSASGTLVSDFENGDTIDGVVLATGDRILIKDQASADNGVYTVEATGAPTRATDMAAADTAASAFMFVEEGTLNGDKGFVCTNDDGSDVVGTDTLVFTQFTGLGQVTAGSGLTKTGDTMDINLEASNPSLQVSTDELGIKFDTGGGLEKTASGTGINLEASSPSMQISGNELGVKIDTAAALEKGASGLGINIEATNPSLQFSSNELGVKIDSAGGLEKDAGGLQVKVVSTDELTIDASGLNVEGVPTLFNIGATAVGSTVTAPNLDTLTDGSETTLHSHAAGQSTEVTADTGGFTTKTMVYWSANDAAKNAAATSNAAASVFGIALDTTSAASAGTVISAGPAAAMLTGATAGDRYFMADAGTLTTDSSTISSGNYVVQVGYAMNATDLWVAIEQMGKKA